MWNFQSDNFANLAAYPEMYGQMFGAKAIFACTGPITFEGKWKQSMLFKFNWMTDYISISMSSMY